ncbi:hypothetical protein Q7P35_005106 [Cladosporium inversicolor]
MPAIPPHNLPCTWLAPTALLMSFAAGIGFATLKIRHSHAPFSIAQPTISFLVKVALVALEDATPGLSTNAFGKRSLAASSVLVTVAIDDEAVGLTDAFASVRITPDNWVELIIWIRVRVGVY